MRSSFSMCSKVVLPALSSPKNTNLPVFFIKPGKYSVRKQEIRKKLNILHCMYMYKTKNAVLEGS